MAIVVVVLVLLLFAGVLAGVVAVVVGTMRKGRMGINVEQVRCPRCGAEQPRVRKPANARQALWGGSTCAGCGLELDKWGGPVAR